MKLYIGAEQYAPGLTAELCSLQDINGIILGDMFCTKRMFSGGIAGEIRCIQLAAEYGMEIVYQSPLYVTSRNCDEVESILEMLVSVKTEVFVIVQDMGLVSLIHERFPRFRIVWGQMGRAREFMLNSGFLQLLAAEGVYGVEISDAEMTDKLTCCGLIPCCVYGHTVYNTVGRICYLKYQGMECCREDCIGGRYSLREPVSGSKMTINGYMLGKKLVYSDKMQELLASDKEAVCMLYVSSMAELNERLRQCKNNVVL